MIFEIVMMNIFNNCVAGSLKQVSAIVYQISIFQQMIALQKL